MLNAPLVENNMFNTLAFSKKMQNVGMTQEVAEELASTLFNLHLNQFENLLTKKEFSRFEGEIKKEIDDLPKIIIFYHSNFNDKSAYFIKKYTILKNMFPLQAENLKLSNYNISINGLDTCNDTIIFNCHQYKLDSCLIDNKYSTVGITCNNKKIVNNNNQLIDFNWNYKKSPNVANKFCFKQNQDGEECITFNEGVRLYVYVRNDTKEMANLSADNKTTYDTSPKTVNEIILALAKMIQENKQL